MSSLSCERENKGMHEKLKPGKQNEYPLRELLTDLLTVPLRVNESLRDGM